MEIQIREGNREQKRKLRVCAYCRVSTDADEQENSLENQIRHYETVIKANLKCYNKVVTEVANKI